jgi:hypothetical protein
MSVESKAQSPSVGGIGGVPLEIEDAETVSYQTSLSFGPTKLFMTLWNFKAFILVIWGFFGMVEATLRATHVAPMEQFVSSSMASSINDINDIECFDVKESDISVKSMGYPFFFPFLAINLCWMLWIVIRSNILWYRTDELGFHICWVEIRKKFSYKIWVMLDFAYTFACLSYAVARVSALEGDVQARTFPVLLNGVFQVCLGLWSLYSPLEETLSYGDRAMVSPIRCSYFDEAGKAINRYQDSLLAALARGKSNYTWMEEATGATKEECEQILFDISATEHASEKEKKGFSFC